MQQCARDLQPSHLSAREVANLAAGAIGESDARQHVVAAATGLAPGDAMQGRVIKQVLRHREVEVECARLKNHTEQPQRFAWRKSDIMAENTDAPGLNSK